jgi:ribosomal protein S8
MSEAQNEKKPSLIETWVSKAEQERLKYMDSLGYITDVKMRDMAQFGRCVELVEWDGEKMVIKNITREFLGPVVQPTPDEPFRALVEE